MHRGCTLHGCCVTAAQICGQLPVTMGLRRPGRRATIQTDRRTEGYRTVSNGRTYCETNVRSLGFYQGPENATKMDLSPGEMGPLYLDFTERTATEEPTRNLICMTGVVDDEIQS